MGAPKEGLLEPVEGIRLAGEVVGEINPPGGAGPHLGNSGVGEGEVTGLQAYRSRVCGCIEHGPTDIRVYDVRMCGCADVRADLLELLAEGLANSVDVNLQGGAQGGLRRPLLPGGGAVVRAGGVV
eukprot:2087170-Pyramimonas_sp.AAC.2